MPHSSLQKGKNMKGIYIDPSIQSASIIEGDFSDFRAIQDAINVDCFTVVCSIKDHTIFCDDEGLLKNPQAFTMFDSYPEPLSGRLLILGSTVDGDSCDCKMSIESLSAQIRFMNLGEVQKMYSKKEPLLYD